MTDLLDKLIFLVLGAFLGAIIKHYLGRDSARADRIHAARAKIRGWIDLIEATHPSFLIDSHKEVCQGIGLMRNTLTDDLRFWQKNRFGRACENFMKTTSDECRPIVTPSPSTGNRSEEDQKRETENWFKPGILLRSRLEAILKTI